MFGGAGLRPPTTYALPGRLCPDPSRAPDQGSPPAQGPRVGQPAHLLKDAVVPHFAGGFVPHDQNLRGEERAEDGSLPSGKTQTRGAGAAASRLGPWERVPLPMDSRVRMGGPLPRDSCPQSVC